ncbi:uncharacterized protein EI90DRAFT_3069906 [Cantharellus anzutake]|uniref:uncharacterized protein n=1 Tax=Cantharellus anzutake TaxID=1750568 RepID=UPI001903EE56|nr:uncharacterized protein EI90DRAFT_3069906 [Cantharellus anzutake]KAF8326609.1 hypothetical protein EI90DRAFT_3069906 [Cantharellus anzutake]
MSIIGQGKDRGGGTEKVLINWLPQYLPPNLGKEEGKKKVNLLEVGALKPDNYDSYSSWISNTPIDLRSRHPKIIEQDFLLLDPVENREKWDVISLSLVINFVPSPHDRGKMLRLARSFLKSPTGLMFLALPSACIQNSRYLDRTRLGTLLHATGFRIVVERCKAGGKIVYLLCQADAPYPLDRSELPSELTTKRTLREGNRNNFAILL